MQAKQKARDKNGQFLRSAEEILDSFGFGAHASKTEDKLNGQNDDTESLPD